MKAFYIENFKNFKNLQINNLLRVNLIVGKNNVGKSTLLEAISLYLSQGSSYQITKLLEHRGELGSRYEETDEERKDHFLSLFYGYKENYSRTNDIFLGVSPNDLSAVRLFQVYIKERIEKDSDGIERKTRMRLFEEDLQDTDNALDSGFFVSSSNPYIMTYGGLRKMITSRDSNMSFQFVDARVFDVDQNAILFDKISLSPDEDYVVEALQIINPQIERIAFVTSGNRRERYPIVTMKNDSRRYRLSSMGDGINRILTIILSMLNCKNGVFLLDEFETGLHYSVQERLWEIVFLLSRKLNIQVFATSHSRDCIEGFAIQNTDKEGLLIRLESRGNDEIIPMIYSDRDDILFAIKKDIEIR